MANSIVIELELDESGAVKGLKNVGKEAKKQGEKAAKDIEDPIDKAFKNINRSVSTATALFAAAGAAALTFGKSIQAAQIQEAAIERLNQQLKLTGELSTASTQGLQEYAAELQKISEFGDEAIIDQIALAKSFGATNEQAKQIASTAIDLAKSFGISLESATRNAARTLGGFAGELGEVIPELKDLTAEQLRAGAGIDLLTNRFDGAGKNLNSFGFVTNQASNAFGDLLEEIGSFATKNQSFIGAIKDSIKFTNDFAAGLKGIREGILGIQDAPVDALGKLDREIAKNVDKIQLLKETLKSREGTATGFLLGFSVNDAVRIRTEIDNLEKAIAKQIEERKGLLDVQDEEIKKRSDNIAKIQEERAARTEEAEASKLFTQAAIQSEEQLALAAIQRAAAVNELREKQLISERTQIESLAQIEQEKQDRLAAIRQAAAERQIEQTRDLTASIQNGLRQQEISFVQLGKTVANVATRGFGNAFQNIGRALASGENASQAFVDTVKNTIGDLASSFGDYYIARGIAASADPLQGGPAVGGPLIVAGAGLKILSGILGATAAAGSGGGAVATQDVSGDTEFSPVATAEPEKEVTTNQIIVQGDVFDSEETGLRIFDIISQQSEKNGNVIVGGAFA